MNIYQVRESLEGMIVNDEQEYAFIRVWFEGDRRDGITEVHFECSAPPSDIEDSIFDWIYDMTGMTRNDFRYLGKLATVIRSGEVVPEMRVI